jgi:hypothetical protein
MKRFVLAGLASAAALMSSPAVAQGACNRELLQGIADDWVAAIEKGSPFELKLGEWVDYQENLEIGFMSAFFDGTPRKVDWHRALLDTTACKVAVESVILDEARPMVLASVLTNGFFGVSPISNIVTDKGDWLFDAKATYEHARAEDWSPIPEGQRMTRQQLIAAADAYLDTFSDKSVEVPWGRPCARLEGGAYIGGNGPDDTCDIGVPEGVPMVERQYVVDEVLGAVNVQLRMGQNRRPDSHTFRIENGKIRFIHTVTNCGDQPNCGFPPLGQRPGA